MKTLGLAVLAALAASAVAVPTVASAHGWDRHHHHRPHCTWVMRHHHRVKVCR